MSLTEKHDSESEFKRKRSESPVPTSTSYEESGGEYKNKRVKPERAASPTHSYVSLRSDMSMDPPYKFNKGETFPLDLRVRIQRAASPTHSYLSLRTDFSMDPPTNFKAQEALYLDTRMGLDRASSPTLSSVSEWTECFVEQPTNSKTEATFHLNPRLLTENHLKCPICKSMLKDPVSISCGHNYCRDCINTFWDSCAEEYVCPECGRGSKTRPELNTNTALAEVVKNLQQAGFSPALPPSSYAGPEDVACDFCSERRLKAVKSCSTCDVFLCETHIKDHYMIPALQKHTLCDVTGAMEKKLSQKFLPTDNSFSNTNCELQEEKDGSISDSVLNTSMAETKHQNEMAEISTSESKVNKDNKEMCSILQQEILGLKKTFSKFKEINSKKHKYDEDEEYYEEEDYEEGRSDDDEEWYENDIEDVDDDDGEEKYNYDDEEDNFSDYDEDKEYYEEEDYEEGRSDNDEEWYENDNEDDNDDGEEKYNYDDEEDNFNDYDEDTNDWTDRSDRSNLEDDNDEDTYHDDEDDYGY